MIKGRTFVRSPDPATDQAMEELRLGTREQWESPLTHIIEGETRTFNHTLGEIPWVVDVVSSESDRGKQAVDSNSSVTVTKTDTQITVTNNYSDGLTRYFCVRLM